LLSLLNEIVSMRLLIPVLNLNQLSEGNNQFD
jgi:hypothetical protein